MVRGTTGSEASASMLLQAHGAFEPPAGWVVAAAPDSDKYEWMDRAYAWSNRKIAHLFQNGWATGTFRGKSSRGRDEDNNCQWDVYYHCERRTWVHKLPLSEYGCAGLWAILEKARKPTKRRRR